MASDRAGYVSLHSAAAYKLLEAPVVAGMSPESDLAEHTDPAVDVVAEDMAVAALELVHIGYMRAL